MSGNHSIDPIAGPVADPIDTPIAEPAVESAGERAARSATESAARHAVTTMGRANVRRSMFTVFAPMLLVLATLLTGACGNVTRGSDRGEITVSAAASLTEAFTELTNEFIAANPGVVVRTNFGSSAQLAEQVISGAPVDVVAFADNRTMDRLDDAGLIGPVRTFALNSMVIVTKPDNPKGIESLADLASPDVGVVSLCRIEAPCGTYAELILGSAQVELDGSRITRGQDVKDTLGAVTNGDAEVAIVYRTDAITAREQVTVITIPDSVNVAASYPIAVVERAVAERTEGTALEAAAPDSAALGSAGSESAASDSAVSGAVSDTAVSGAVPGGDMTVARAFVDFVLSDKGRAVLSKYGFEEP